MSPNASDERALVTLETSLLRSCRRYADTPAAIRHAMGTMI